MLRTTRAHPEKHWETGSAFPFPQTNIASHGVNVLSHDQETISNQFARKGTDKWAGIEWTPTRNLNPVIAGTLMWLDCDIWAEHEAGDHLIVIGRVNDMSPTEWHTQQPLLYFKGQYRHLRELDLAAG